MAKCFIQCQLTDLSERFSWRAGDATCQGSQWLWWHDETDVKHCVLWSQHKPKRFRHSKVSRPSHNRCILGKEWRISLHASSALQQAALLSSSCAPTFAESLQTRQNFVISVVVLVTSLQALNKAVFWCVIFLFSSTQEKSANKTQPFSTVLCTNSITKAQIFGQHLSGFFYMSEFSSGFCMRLS